MFCSQIWLRNIFSILQDHSSQNQILGKKYVSGELFTILNCFENMLKNNLRSPFQQLLLNGKQFLDAARMF